MIKKLIFIGVALMLHTKGLALDVILSAKPANIPLPVGKEIVIKFPKVVYRVDIKDLTPMDLEHYLRPDGVLLIKALKGFGKKRLIAQYPTGNSLAFDVDAQIGAVNYESINLIDPKSFKQQAHQPIKKENKPKENPNKPSFLKNNTAKTKSQSIRNVIGFNQMVQFGFRNHVGPSRLIGSLPAKKVRVNSKGIKNFVRVWGRNLKIKPLSQWKIDGKYITVLLVNNISSKPIQFDPRALRGRLMFSAALNGVIQPQGSIQDQTLWAVITKRPFNKAIK